MAHAQKPDFVFRRNGRVHLNRRQRQFSRLLAAEVCASSVVKLDTPCSEVVWRVLATHSIRQFPPSVPVPCRHRVPSHFNWTLLTDVSVQPACPIIYRMSQEECARLREAVPYVKIYRYNPKHLYTKLNVYGDNGQRNLKLSQLLHTYWLPNTY